MTDILVLGSAGQVGSELMDGAFSRGRSIYGCDRDQCDITDLASVESLVARHVPRVIINAAAYTAVDKAESEAELAFAINRDGPANLARVAARHAAALLHISTDYVFDGGKQGPYLETDPVKPLGIYGRSKEAGEVMIRAALDRHVILRTAWVFGRHGHNFVKTMLRLGSERSELSVVADQLGCPTPARAIALGLATIAERILADPGQAGYGTFHFVGSPPVTWHGFAQAIFAAAARHGRPIPIVHAISTADYPTPARRPANSVLSTEALQARYAIGPADWRPELERVVEAVLGGLVA
jgi:dTDP-4-dehydrorhamnose reductase